MDAELLWPQFKIGEPDECGEHLRLNIIVLQQIGHKRLFACDFCGSQVETCSLSAVFLSRMTLAEEEGLFSPAARVRNGISCRWPVSVS